MITKGQRLQEVGFVMLIAMVRRDSYSAEKKWDDVGNICEKKSYFLSLSHTALDLIYIEYADTAAF